MVPLTQEPEVKVVPKSLTRHPLRRVKTQMAQGPTVAESLHIDTASSPDADSLDEEEGATHQDPHRKDSHSAHEGGGFSPPFCAALDMPRLQLARGGGGGGGTCLKVVRVIGLRLRCVESDLESWLEG